ncbi:hypothetical protein OOZ63_15225 [Paucibacter sp. PLA-PC-4]|uniref:hypothetical protein n=1 Tax=Paucibacter sp. PLA-PC-4 TaxID=2993655 RepID=UPI002248A8A4|nr:hypothetical protein [Paucibacter sp. PLA-PC-4]MCX2863182.1 hypothetical protein [Paucibacter sp. PLA-PC-4]
MSTTSLNLPLHVMPSDVARANSAQASGARLIAAGSAVWRFLSAIGEARGRQTIEELIKSTEITRPELSAALRRANNGNWS